MTASIRLPMPHNYSTTVPAQSQQKNSVPYIYILARTTFPNVERAKTGAKKEAP